VDGDGLEDILVGAPKTSRASTGSAQGTAYLIYASTLDGTTQRVLDQADHELLGENGGDVAGDALSGAGDLDGDGFADLVIAASENDDGGAYSGKIYLVLADGLGAPGDYELADADHIFIGEAAGDYAGSSVAGAGDVDGDGLADVVVGSGASSLGGSYSGAAHVLLGGSLGLSFSNSLSSSDYRILGDPGDGVGVSVAGAGDIDGDARDDLVLGASSADGTGHNQGRVYVVLGGSLGITVTITPSSADYIFTGQADDDSAGWSVSGGGDVDADGLDDILVGASGTGPAAYLLLGSSLSGFGHSSTVDLGLADHIMFGESNTDSAGKAVAGGGDFDGDGRADLLIGAFENDDGGYAAGKSYLVTSGL
jgi:hypothetical protein